MPITDTTRPVTASTPLGANKLIVQSMTGEEYLSGLFRYSVQFLSEDNDVDFTQIVGKQVTLTSEQADGTKLHYSGMVGKFRHNGKDPRYAFYQAEIYPWLWLLTMNADCRIYQNKTALEIIKAVFSDLGFTDFKDSTTSTYLPREYCVQYNESAFAFVSRLMEEEGIFYYFTHDESTHKLVLSDDSSAASAIGGESALSVRHHEWTEGPAILDCDLEQQVVVGQFKVDDYNFETPSTDLIVTASASETARSIYEYPGNLLKKDDLESRAKLRLEGCESEGMMLRGSSSAPAMRAGSKFSVQDHKRSQVNADWVIRSVSFHFDQNGAFSNSFEAIPLDVKFRPPRTTPRPRIYGAQTATVVGKSGEEIWTDKYGRIKVQFHWDQVGSNDENSSCWIRVAQGWAGKSWGSIFIPRIGQEVVVSFLEGDPDRPLATACVYNGMQTVPYTLPDDQTKSTIKSNSSKGGGGFNEFRFEDKKDSEEVFLQAQKDYNINVLNDQTSTIKNNRKTTVQEKDDTLIVDKGNRTIQVNTGNETHEVKGTRDLTITGNESHTNKADFKQDVTGNFTLKVQGNITIEATGSISIKAGTEFKLESGTAMSSKSGTETKVEAGTDLSTKAGMNIKNEGGMNVETKAGMNIKNEAGVVLEHKGGATATVEGGGMLSLKGGLIKLN